MEDLPEWTVSSFPMALTEWIFSNGAGVIAPSGRQKVPFLQGSRGQLRRVFCTHRRAVEGVEGAVSADLKAKAHAVQSRHVSHQSYERT